MNSESSDPSCAQSTLLKLKLQTPRQMFEQINPDFGHNGELQQHSGELSDHAIDQIVAALRLSPDQEFDISKLGKLQSRNKSQNDPKSNKEMQEKSVKRKFPSASEADRKKQRTEMTTTSSAMSSDEIDRQILMAA